MIRPAGSAKLLRAINSSATLSHLLQSGRLTRAELRDRTGLSKPTSSEMLRLLTDAGLAMVAGRTAGGPGPTAEIYAPNPDAAHVVAISVRDTIGEDRPGLGVALGDLAGEIRYRSDDWIDFAAVAPADAIVGALQAACAGAGTDPGRVRRVQIGVAGSYDARADRIHHVDVPGWDAPGVAAAIRARLATVDRGPAPIDVAIENDVNLAAIAERHRGIAGPDSFAMLWLDHGLGLAVDLGDSLLQGARGGAGEIGYLPLATRPLATRPRETRPPAGGGGLATGGPPAELQDLVGGPAVIELARAAGVTASTPGAAVAAALLQPGDFLDQLANRVAFALASVIAILDPPLVVLAGAVAQAGGVQLRDAVAGALAAYPRASTDGHSVEIAVTAVDDDAVLLGALDAGLAALREALISSLAQPSPD